MRVNDPPLSGRKVVRAFPRREEVSGLLHGDWFLIGPVLTLLLNQRMGTP